MSWPTGAKKIWIKNDTWAPGEHRPRLDGRGLPNRITPSRTGLGKRGPLAIFRCAGRAREFGRVEELPLQLGTGTRDDAGTDDFGALQRVRDRPQERVTHPDVQRPERRRARNRIGREARPAAPKTGRSFASSLHRDRQPRDSYGLGPAATSSRVRAVN